MTITIALVGPAGSGKSSATDYLVERYGAKRYAFARPLKEIAKRTLDLTDAQVWGTQAEKEADDPRYGFSPRWFLQRLGTEGVRAVLGDDFWTRMTLELIKRDAPALAVIEDARFTNECDAVREGWLEQGRNDAGAYFTKAPGYVVRLNPAPGVGASTDAGTHASEREWSRVTADFEVFPKERGLEILYVHLADICRSLHLFPVRRETAL